MASITGVEIGALSRLKLALHKVEKHLGAIGSAGKTVTLFALNTFDWSNPRKYVD